MEEIAKILPRVLKQQVRGENPPVLELLGPLWPQVAGQALAEQARPAAFHGGTLTLMALSAPWATELRGLREEVRSAVNRALGRSVVKRIRVKCAPGYDIAWMPRGLDAGSAASSRPLVPAPDPPALALDASSDLDPELRKVLLQSFAKYFARGTRRAV